MTTSATPTYVLTLSCPDRLGLVHAVSGFLLERAGNIEEAAQFNDHDTGLFFMRVQFACSQLSHEQLKTDLAAFAAPLNLQWKLHATAQPMRTVIMVSQQGHCLNDLLFRWKSGLLPLDIRAIVSNHRDFYQLAASYNVPFHHIPVTAATKAQVEQRQFEIVQAEDAELVVLARYMQISERRPVPQAGRACHQHPSQLLAEFQGCQALLPGTRPGREADWGHGPLCNGRPGRRPHHRAGRGPRGPQQNGGRPDRPGPRHRKPGAGSRRQVAQRTPRAAQRPQNRHLQIKNGSVALFKSDDSYLFNVYPSLHAVRVR
jgi:formyltetrahydrofolate deformylase